MREAGLDMALTGLAAIQAEDLGIRFGGVIVTDAKHDPLAAGLAAPVKNLPVADRGALRTAPRPFKQLVIAIGHRLALGRVAAKIAKFRPAILPVEQHRRYAAFGMHEFPPFIGHHKQPRILW